MKKTDNETRLQELKDLVIDFRDTRNWRKHHTPKNLAISIALEAAELMEHFQWDTYTKYSKDDLADELADIVIYCLNFASVTDIDVSSSVRNKLKKINKKYPPDVFNKDKDSLDEYYRIKKARRGSK